MSARCHDRAQHEYQHSTNPHTSTCAHQTLSQFTCSRGEWFADEVEQFVRHDLLPWQGDPAHAAFDRRALAVFHDGDPIAVVAHEILTELSRDDGTPLEGIFLPVVAIAADYQGAEIQSDSAMKLSEYLRRVIRNDVRQGQLVAGIVATDNVRSLRMCTTWNLRQEIAASDRRYVWRIGVLQ